MSFELKTTLSIILPPKEGDLLPAEKGQGQEVRNRQHCLAAKGFEIPVRHPLHHNPRNVQLLILTSALHVIVYHHIANLDVRSSTYGAKKPSITCWNAANGWALPGSLRKLPFLSIRSIRYLLEEGVAGGVDYGMVLCLSQIYSLYITAPLAGGQLNYSEAQGRVGGSGVNSPTVSEPARRSGSRRS